MHVIQVQVLSTVYNKSDFCHSQVCSSQKLMKAKRVDVTLNAQCVCSQLTHKAVFWSRGQLSVAHPFPPT